MKYHISRDGQTFGPYTLAELQRYVAEGNILLTDLACGEGMTQWVPVQQVLSNLPPQQPVAPKPVIQQAPAYPQYQQPQAPQYPAPQYQPNPQAAQAGGAPMPPNLHWALVLVIGIFCGIFTIVWMFIQASFVKKLRPDTKCITYYVAGWAGMILGYIVMAAAGMAHEESLIAVGGLVCMGGVVMMILGHFALKSSLEEYYNTVEPLNLHLSGVMTFFFNVIYFQYHLNRIYNYKTTGVMRA